MTTDKKNKLKLTMGVYGAYVLVGMIVTVFGPVNSMILVDVKTTMAKLGLLITFMSLGRVIFAFGGGVLFNKFGKRIVLMNGLFFIVAGLALMSLFDFSLLFYFATFLLGAGHGLFDVSCNTIIADIYEDKAGNALNLLHLFFSFGSFFGPIVFAVLIKAADDWHAPFFLLLIFGTVLLIYDLIFAVFKTEKKDTKINKFYVKPILIIIGMIMFFYVGVSQGINTWVNTFLDSTQNMTLIVSSVILSLYNLGIMVGRVIASRITQRVGYRKMILIGSSSSLIFISLAIITGDPIFSGFTFFMTGLSFGPLFPTSLALATSIFKERRAQVVGILSAIASIGSMSIPFLTGQISDHFGSIEYGMLLSIVMLISMVFCSIYVYRKVSG